MAAPSAVCVFLARFDAVTHRVDGQIDLRNNDLATLVILCLDNDGAISNKKRKRFADRVPAHAFDLVEAAAREVLAIVGGDPASGDA